MNQNGEFGAPWCRGLRWVTAVAIAVCVGIPLIGIVSFPSKFLVTRTVMVALPLLIPIISAFFMVRGYALKDHTLTIHRLGWNSRFDLRSLVSATFDPAALSGSIRLFGNGGLFAFCGLFRNRKLGNYRAFGTDPRRSVILRFNDRVVVVTPDAPERFVDEILKEK
jgi:Bacterial PH domain